MASEKSGNSGSRENSLASSTVSKSCHDGTTGQAPCQGCTAHLEGRVSCSHAVDAPAFAAHAEPPTTTIGRSSFVRGLGAAAGLIVAGGALGTAAKVAAKQQTIVSATVSAATVGAGPGRFLGSVKALAKGQAATYTDPASGDPALLIRTLNGSFDAYDAVCTHAGCTVQFDAKRQLIVCPCHGATYDPVQGAKPIAGPTSQPLARLSIHVDTAQNVYALDAKANGSHANQLKAAPAYAGQTGDDGGGGTRAGGGEGGGGDDGSTVRMSSRRLSATSRQSPRTPSRSAHTARSTKHRIVRDD